MVTLMTRGFEAASKDNEELSAWMLDAAHRIRDNNPDFIVAEPDGKKERLEDDGRTLILPVSKEQPRCYATFNETGGVTFMLAEEY